MSPYLYLIPVLLPLLGGAAILFIRFQKSKWRQIYLSCLITFNTLIVFLFIFFRPSESLTILPLAQGLSIRFRLDGTGAVFAGLAAGLWPFATLYAFEYMKHEERKNNFFAFYTMSYGVTMGIAFSANLMTLYLFYELLTLVTLPLVMHSMDHKSIRAGIKYLVYSIGGAAFAFIGFVIIVVYSSSTDFAMGGVLEMAKIGEQKQIIYIAYLMMFFGFGVKAAVFPFHGWLPTASVAPTPVTALLHAVAVVKAGVFSILRVTYFSFGTAFLSGTYAQYIPMAFAIFTIVFGSCMAVKEQHMKRRMAYSTISNLSYILFGITLMTSSGLVGSFTHMIFHGIMKICLFFCVGAVMHQTGKEYLFEITGYGKKMKTVFTCFTLASIALIGIPPLAGFISKWSLASAAVETALPLAYAGVGALLLSALLTGIYLFTIVIQACFPSEGEKQAEKESNEIKDPNWYMKVPLLIFGMAILIFGVYSTPFVSAFTKISQGLL